MRTDGVALAMGQQFKVAFTEYSEGFSIPEIEAIATVNITTMQRWFKTGGMRATVLLRLDNAFAARGRRGFLDRVYGRQALAPLVWASNPLDLSQVENPAHLAMIEAGTRIGENPVEWLAKTGLLPHAHVLMFRGPEVISTRIGSETLVSAALLGRDIRDRADRGYAQRTYDDVLKATEHATCMDIFHNEGDGYHSLRIPFREHKDAPLQIVALPHNIRSSGRYVVH